MPEPVIREALTARHLYETGNFRVLPAVVTDVYKRKGTVTMFGVLFSDNSNAIVPFHDLVYPVSHTHTYTHTHTHTHTHTRIHTHTHSLNLH
jgi:hypothetical protein